MADGDLQTSQQSGQNDRFRGERGPRDGGRGPREGGNREQGGFRIRLSGPPGSAPADTRDCRIVDVQLARSSGEQAWDRAAEQAIRKSSPWPRTPSGSCPSEAIEITQRPRD